MSREQVTGLVGQDVVFMYDGQERRVNVERINDANNGSVLIVGRDAIRNNQYRSFNISRISELRTA
jgi:hypothetical protein